MRLSRRSARVSRWRSGRGDHDTDRPPIAVRVLLPSARVGGSQRGECMAADLHQADHWQGPPTMAQRPYRPLVFVLAVTTGRNGARPAVIVDDRHTRSLLPQFPIT